LLKIFNMKTLKIIYWISTGIISLMMTVAAYSYMTNDQVKQAFVLLGFPSYFRVELAVAKLIGAVLLVMPFKSRLKDWVYAGFTIVFISALIAHIAGGLPLSTAVMPVVMLVVLLGSYLSYLRLFRGVTTTKENLSRHEKRTIAKSGSQCRARLTLSRKVICNKDRIEDSNRVLRELRQIKIHFADTLRIIKMRLSICRIFSCLLILV